MWDSLFVLNEGRPNHDKRASIFRQASVLLVVCAAYYFAVGLGLRLQLGFLPVAVLWPSNAILTAVVLLATPRRWWLYLVALIPVHIAAFASRSVGPEWFASQILHNYALAIATAVVIRYFAPDTPHFDRVKKTAVFLTAATLVPGVAAALLVGTASAILPEEALIRHGWSGGWWHVTGKIAMCNSVTLLGVLPAILVWLRPEGTPIWPVQRRQLAEFALVMFLLISASLIAFTRNDMPLYLHSALFLVPMPFLLWSAARFGTRGAATALVAIVCISVWGAYQSEGPFIDRSSSDRALSVQLFWVLLAWPGMLLAAAIEERKAAEGVLLRAQQRYELATAAGHVSVCSYNYRTQEVQADPSLSLMLGYSPDDAKTGGEWLQRIHPEDLPSVLAREDLIKSGDAPRNASGHTPIPQIQYRLRCANGSYRWVNDSGTLYRDGDEPSLAVGTITDITELKKAQEASLAHQKLESLGLLAGGIAHDFNNLLGSIHAEAELLEANIGDNRSPLEEVQTIKSISIRASEIVRQLMIYAGQEKGDCEPLNLSKLVAETLALLKISISKSAVLHTDLAEGLPLVMGNESQIRQVVMNLVLNASDALGDRGGMITIYTSLSRQQVRLVVADTGSGMSKEFQARIFDPFFTTKTSGRGLGLAVVQGVVRAHKGVIELTSAPGQGTTFEILLPVAGQAPGVTSSAEYAARARNGRTAGTVLLVEDEDALRLSVAKLLRKEGLTVIDVGDGTTAVDLFRDHPKEIDVVLLDMTIPGTPSSTVIEEASVLRPEARLLLTSAYSREMVFPKNSSDQIKGFIRKPFQLRDLVSQVREALSA
jgi:PAS domain S-box-containing protein